jgi:hypothetical protein
VDRPVSITSETRRADVGVRKPLARVVAWVFIGLLWVLLAGSIAGVTGNGAGRTPLILLLAAAGAASLFVTFGTIGFPVLLGWLALTGIAYPFVNYPTINPLLTFDRIWVMGMLGCVALGYRTLRPCRETRFLLAAFGFLAVTFGLRAFTTQAGTNAPIKIWLDAIVVPLVLFTVTLIYARTARDAQRIAGAMMLAGAVLAALGIASLFGFNAASYYGGQVRLESDLGTFRLSGPYPAPEPYGLSLIACLAASIYWLRARSEGKRLVGSLIVLFQLVAISLTLFRATWIGAVFVLIAALGLRRHRPGRLLLVCGLAAVIAFVAMAELKHTRVYADRVNNTDNIWGRLATYQQGIDIFQTAPLFGIGVDGYHAVAELRTPRVYNGVDSVTYPHSSFVGILAEQGLVGFSAFLLVCVAVVRLLRSLFRRARLIEDATLAGATIGAAFGYLIMSLTLTMLPYGPSNSFFAVLIGLAAARLDAIARADSPGSGPPAPSPRGRRQSTLNLPLPATIGDELLDVRRKTG